MVVVTSTRVRGEMLVGKFVPARHTGPLPPHRPSAVFAMPSGAVGRTGVSFERFPAIDDHSVTAAPSAAS